MMTIPSMCLFRSARSGVAVLACLLSGGTVFAADAAPCRAPKAEITLDIASPVLATISEEAAACMPDTSAKATPGPEGTGASPLTIALGNAVVMALENNASFRIDRLDPAIYRTYEATARAAFDPVLSGSVSRTKARTDEDVNNQTGNDIDDSDALRGHLGVSQFLPTGTTLSADAELFRSDTNGPYSENASHGAEFGVSMTQALLRGFGPRVNLVTLRQARLSSLASTYELRGVAETLIASVEVAYWNVILSERSIEIYEQSLAIAEEQIGHTRDRVKAGSVAETELTAAEAEVASRREALIDAKSALATARLTLIRLLNPGGAGMWSRPVVLTDVPEALPDGGIDDVEAHVALGLRQRPDLNQARLALDRGALETVRTRNGLLPRLDLFIRLGNTRYADSFSAVSDRDGHGYDTTVGVALEHALGNRAEKAAHERAVFSREQLRAALLNMEQLVQVDIRAAHIEVRRTLEQMNATAATRKLREESLRTEREKFGVGKSTAILVSQAWRDLVESQIAEVRNRINHRKALMELYRLEGSLLERRGVLPVSE